MKKSSAPGQPHPPDRSVAWGFLLTNLVVLPGMGSVAAGRRSGYAQIILALGGLLLSAYFVVVALYSLVKHRAELIEAASVSTVWDQVEKLPVNWRAHLWIGGLGLVLFAIGWCWALATSLQILNASVTHSPPTLGDT